MAPERSPQSCKRYPEGRSSRPSCKAFRRISSQALGSFQASSSGSPITRPARPSSCSRRAPTPPGGPAASSTHGTCSH
eukprot:2361261-Alexandrium_andersonii.AAC.1